MWDVEINFGVRPCIVNKNNEEKKALFHMWEAKSVAADLYIGGRPDGQISMVLGLVEYEDGTVDEVEPRQIRFVDKKIKDYVFPRKKKGELND